MFRPRPYWLTLLEPPESKTITIRRAHIQDPQVSSSDSPVVLVEFQQELSDSIGLGEEVVLVGYVRSRPMNKTSKKDRNREVYLVVTGIESSSVQSDIQVLARGERNHTRVGQCSLI